MRGAAVQMSAMAAAATCCARMFLLSSTPTRECITSCMHAQRCCPVHKCQTHCSPPPDMGMEEAAGEGAARHAEQHREPTLAVAWGTRFPNLAYPGQQMVTPAVQKKVTVECHLP